MENKDIATLILGLEKCIIKDYSTALTEASTIELQNTIKEQFDSSLKAHRDLFDLMNSKGCYTIEAAENNKIEKEYNKLSSDLGGNQ